MTNEIKHCDKALIVVSGFWEENLYAQCQVCAFNFTMSDLLDKYPNTQQAVDDAFELNNSKKNTD